MRSLLPEQQMRHRYPSKDRPTVLSRRAALGAGAFAVATVWVGNAFAGSYLDRAAVLVHIATEELGYLRRKLYDEELARTLQQVAAARLHAAGTMLVPPEVVQAHPHLLLMLENCERATNGAVERKTKEFLKYARLAQDEELLFRAVLKQLGWSLPEFKT